jgi:proteasome lid subunit RPN8/RPN11
MAADCVTLLERGLLLEVYEHARECYPEECCGILTGPPNGPPRDTVRCTNIQNRRHASGESTLDARHAFWIDDKELLRAIERAEGAGDCMLTVYHSHTDAGAYMSDADVQAALGPDGAPVWPGVGHLVVSVQQGSVREAVYFEWDDAAREFAGREVKETA